MPTPTLGATADGIFAEITSLEAHLAATFLQLREKLHHHLRQVEGQTAPGCPDGCEGSVKDEDDMIHAVYPDDDIESSIPSLKDLKAPMQDADDIMDCVHSDYNWERTRSSSSSVMAKAPLAPLKEPPALQLATQGRLLDLSHKTPEGVASLRARAVAQVSSMADADEIMDASEFRLHPRWIDLGNKSQHVLEATQRMRRRGKKKTSTSELEAALNMVKLSSLRSLTSQGIAGMVKMRRSFTVLNPNSMERLAWDVVGFFLIVIDAFVLPVSIAWDLPYSANDAAGMFLLVIFWITVTFWTVDVIINFNTGFYEGGRLQRRRLAVAWHYACTWLAFDTGLISLDFVTIASLLSEAETQTTDNSMLRSIRVLRILRGTRLLRLLKFSKLHSVIEEASIAAGKQWLVLVVAIFNTTFLMMACAHLLACFWYYVGRVRSDAGEQSWIDVVGATQVNSFVQYLHAFQWILTPPSPPQVHPASAGERMYCIAIFGIALVVIGSALSKITGTLDELRTINAEKTQKRRQVRQYLQSQGTPLELTSRIMRFVDYKLTRHASVDVDSHLISPSLHLELSVSQRGASLSPHPLFALTLQAFPDVFADVCAAVEHHVYGKSEVVFTIDQLAQEQDRVTGIHWYAEQSLFAEAVLHHATMRSVGFGDVYTLTGQQLGQVITSSPACCAMYVEYAKDLLDRLKSVKARGQVTQEEYESCSKTSCQDNKIYSDVYPDPKTILRAIRLQQDLGCAEEIISDMLAGKVRKDELPGQLQKVFPELHMEGSHALLSPPGERERSESSCLSLVALVCGNYEAFTEPQNEGSKLTKQQWSDLRCLVRRFRPSDDALQAILVLLASRSLGKSRRVLRQIPSYAQRPEQALLCLFKFYKNVVPSVELLTDESFRTIEATLELHQEFNLAQMLQGENVPASIYQLQEMINDKGEDVFKSYIIFLLGFMSGLAGGAGSRFMDAKNSQPVIHGLLTLQHVLDSSPRAIYWNYMTERGKQFLLPHDSPEDLALIRLACLARVQDKNGYKHMCSAWELLDISSRLVLVDSLLADGIETAALVFEFLPLCIEKAQANVHVGLHILLDVMVDLIGHMKAITHKLPKYAEKMMRVDLLDMAMFIEAVQSRFVFQTCISRCLLQFGDGRAYLKMSSYNWGRSREEDSDTTNLAYSMKELLQRHKFLQETVTCRSPEAQVTTGGDPGRKTRTPQISHTA
eukprot:TRINITY_DN2653_c0_g2_i3.p1 TRINITY_DN2653_c0_g2~~TRINITY_DN2653_c0_g2_i3.p1  ORF type:complete len:1208 (-),score=192.20 TRINITY_DN2653_c0_g2_i3:136-3759(-)